MTAKKGPGGPFKRGVVSEEELRYITDNAGKMSVEQLAAQLGRKPETVKSLIRKHYIPQAPANRKDEDQASRVLAKQALWESEQWRAIKSQLETGEASYFEEAYAKLMAQFKGDVLATEETQILDCVKYEIFKARNLIARKKLREKQAALEARLAAPKKSDDADDIDRKLSELRREELASEAGFLKLQERHDALIKALKGTRDQRFDEVESSRESILGFFKSLQHREVQEREGRYAELVKLAAKQEYHRLGRPHEFADGKWDRPILNSETVTGAFDECRDGIGRNAPGGERSSPPGDGRSHPGEAGEGGPAAPLPDLRAAPAPEGPPGNHPGTHPDGDGDHRVAGEGGGGGEE